MSEVKVNNKESIDNALRRFKKECAKSGVLAEAKRENITKSLVLSGRKRKRPTKRNKKRY